MTTTKFDRFREVYLEYISEYNKYKDLLQFSQLIEDTGYTQELTETATKKLSQKLESSGLLAQILIAQMHDAFIVDKERSAYLLSIKTFISRELHKWAWREKKEIKYKWQKLYTSDRIYRQWMPDYLYDILFEVRDIESEDKKNTPYIKKPKKKEVKSFEDCLTDEGKKLLPELIKTYQDCKKPSKIVHMWHAMNNLTTLISKNIFIHTELYRLLTGTFGNVGSYQNFNRIMRRIDNGASKEDDDGVDKETGVIKFLQLVRKS